MLLTIDVGNTTTACALFRSRSIAWRRRVPTPATWSARAQDSLLPLPWAGRVTAAIVSSVVPRLNRGLGEGLRRACRVRPVFLDSRTPMGLILRIDHPEELGADRIADCVGALALFPPPLIVIDSGTAITFDLVDRSGDYRGGCILPGIGIAVQCLADHTAKLKGIEFKIPSSPLGSNTADCIRAGIFYGYVGALQHLITMYRRELGRAAKIVATGGMARYFKDRVAGIDLYAPDLIFHGLRRVHEGLPGRDA